MKSSCSVWDVNTALKPSRYLTGLCILMHGLAAVAAMVAVIPLVVKVVIVCLVAGSAYFQVVRLRMKSSKAVVHISEHLGSWRLTYSNGESLSAELAANVLVWRYLLILPFDAHAQRKWVVIAPDRVESDTFRRLYVRMRFRHLAEPDVLSVFKF